MREKYDDSILQVLCAYFTSIFYGYTYYMVTSQLNIFCKQFNVINLF